MTIEAEAIEEGEHNFGRGQVVTAAELRTHLGR